MCFVSMKSVNSGILDQTQLSFLPMLQDFYLRLRDHLRKSKVPSQVSSANINISQISFTKESRTLTLTKN